MLLVHLHQKEVRLKEIDLLVASSLGIDVREGIEQYVRLLFPGAKLDSVEESKAEARAFLEAEAQKVLIMRPVTSGDLQLTGDGNVDSLRMQAHKGEVQRRSALLNRLRKRA